MAAADPFLFVCKWVWKSREHGEREAGCELSQVQCQQLGNVELHMLDELLEKCETEALVLAKHEIGPPHWCPWQRCWTTTACIDCRHPDLFVPVSLSPIHMNLKRKIAETICFTANRSKRTRDWEVWHNKGRISRSGRDRSRELGVFQRSRSRRCWKKLSKPPKICLDKKKDQEFGASTQNNLHFTCQTSFVFWQTNYRTLPGYGTIFLLFLHSLNSTLESHSSLHRTRQKLMRHVTLYSASCSECFTPHWLCFVLSCSVSWLCNLTQGFTPVIELWLVMELVLKHSFNNQSHSITVVNPFVFVP